jgi:hypothetical protein
MEMTFEDTILIMMTKEKGSEPEVAGSLWKLENSKKMELFVDLPNNTALMTHLDF